MKKILIICHSFPPYPGIGGRRWAKFAKYLSKSGHKVWVIAAKNPYSEQSQWTKDAQNEDVTYLPLKYPAVLKRAHHHSLYHKITYRLALAYVKLFGKGNYYDRSLFWEKQIVRSASEMISRHEIKNVIVTSPPFHLAYHCTKLKDRFKDINLITDIRDLWTEDYSLSALKTMSAERQEYEEKIEKEVLNRSDVVLAVSDQIINGFKKIVPVNNYHTLINGFDEEDFKNVQPILNKSKEKINLVFTGTLYVNLQNLFIPLIESLKKLKKEEPALYGMLSFNFYGHAPNELKHLVTDVDAINLHHRISLPEVYSKISEADLCLLFLTDAYTFSLSTKFYEYLSQKKKIVLFSNKGETSHFIETNHLGYWIAPENTYEGLKKIIELFKKGEIYKWDTALDIQQYSIKNITKELEKHLQ